MLSHAELMQLMRATARHLTGQDVIVRFEEPNTDVSADGAAYKGMDGRPVVLINPGHGRDLLTIFLHELAHVAKHVARLPAVSNAGPVLHAGNPRIDPATARREDEADALADRWRLFAEEGKGWLEYYDSRTGYSPFASKLMRLLKDYPTNP